MPIVAQFNSLKHLSFVLLRDVVVWPLTLVVDHGFTGLVVLVDHWALRWIVDIRLVLVLEEPSYLVTRGVVREIALFRIFTAGSIIFFVLESLEAFVGSSSVVYSARPYPMLVRCLIVVVFRSDGRT